MKRDTCEIIYPPIDSKNVYLGSDLEIGYNNEHNVGPVYMEITV